jgi:glucosamine-6-phosphate deaminase
MRIIQCLSKEEAIEAVATLVHDKLRGHPSAVIGLATGRTMLPVYSSLAQKVQEATTDLSKSFYFMLDEYLGLPDGHPSSFKHYIRSHFLKPLNLRESQVAFPPVHSPNGPEAYETNLKQCGGVDLQLLGLGLNGHVGFNEPGSNKNSRTRIVKLTEETIEANREQFVDSLIPSKAMSMGIETILESKSLLMLATGKSKARVVKYLLNHHDDPTCPATYLKNHPHFTLVLDPDAASSINLKI